MKEQTAMMQLLEKLYEIEKSNEELDEYEFNEDTLSDIIYLAEQLLYEERDQIEEAYVQGSNNIDEFGEIIDSTGHYRYYQNVHLSLEEKEAEMLKEYNDMLTCGRFSELFPMLSGEWEKDKEHWEEAYGSLSSRLEEQMQIDEE
jgi:hypothetical protein